MNKKIQKLLGFTIAINLPGLFDRKYKLTRLTSFITGKIAIINIPISLRENIFNLYIKTFGVDKEDILEPLNSFSNLQEFFTRRVKKREIDYNPKKILSPADSRVLSFTKINSDEVLLIKNKKYSLCEFYTGKENCKYTIDEITNLKKNKENDLYSIIFYLSPGDYHRYHFPFDYKITKAIYIPGFLKPVNKPMIKLTKVYEVNERIILEGISPLGNSKIGLVGALNVGSMTLSFDNDKLFSTGGISDFYMAGKNYEDLEVKAGEEMGMFKFGSTVVMLFEARKGFEFNVVEDQLVRYGDCVGE